jgi:hypothetical protein
LTRVAVEQGPLRHVKPTFHVWPFWAYRDHTPFPYVSRSDHRAESGEIISLGAACLAERRKGQIILAFDSGLVAILDGAEWALEGAPIIDCPDLLLCA